MGGMRSNAVVWVLAMQVAAACATSATYERVDSFSRSTHARTIFHESDFSIYSPFDADQTTTYLKLVREQDQLLRTFFGVEPELPWILVLSPSEELKIAASVRDNMLTVSNIPLYRCSGVQAMASERTAMVYVAPPLILHREGDVPLTNYVAAEMYAKTLRHELVHLYAWLTGISGDPWFDEALPELLEDAPLADERLQIDDVDATLARLTHLPRQDWDLPRALAVREDIRQLEAGKPHPFPPARALTRSFLQFLLIRSDSEDVLGELRHIRSQSLPELLAFEPQWHDWLEQGLGAREASIPPSQ